MVTNAPTRSEQSVDGSEGKFGGIEHRRRRWSVAVATAESPVELRLGDLPDAVAVGTETADQRGSRVRIASATECDHTVLQCDSDAATEPVPGGGRDRVAT